MKKIILKLIKIVNKLLINFNLSIYKYDDISKLNSQYNDLLKLYNVLYDFYKIFNNYSSLKIIDDNLSAECVIFSMDRALQLHSLLSSYFDKVQHPVKLNIFYRTSNLNHEKAYKEVFNIFASKNINIVKQIDKTTFKSQLIEILNSIKSNKIFFLVDDIVFIENIDLLDFLKFNPKICIPSLRLGKNLTKCYTLNRVQSLPIFKTNINIDNDKLYWIWGQGELDWGYPLSLDGNLFYLKEILIMLNNIEFSSPNTLEENLQIFKCLYLHRLGVCYQKSKILNLPINKVQTDNNNISGNIHQDYLLEKWNEGLQLNYQSLYGLKNESAHQEVDIDFIKR